MTLTYPMLNRARRILWLVTGSEKVDMLARCATAIRSIPAGRVRRDQAVVLRRSRSGGRSGRTEMKGSIMRIGIATDHGGFGLKEELVARIRAAGHEVVDFGAHSLNAGRRLSRLRRPARAGGRGREGGSRRGDLRQRRRRVGVRQQGSGHPRRADPRPFLGQARCRGRSHEHPLHGRPDRGTGSRLGSRPDFLAAEYQQRPATSASLGQSGFVGITKGQNSMNRRQRWLNSPSTRSARSRSTRCKRPSPAIPARRWRSRRWSTRSGTA